MPIFAQITFDLFLVLFFLWAVVMFCFCLCLGKVLRQHCFVCLFCFCHLSLHLKMFLFCHFPVFHIEFVFSDWHFVFFILLPCCVFLFGCFGWAACCESLVFCFSCCFCSLVVASCCVFCFVVVPLASYVLFWCVFRFKCKTAEWRCLMFLFCFCFNRS